MPTYTTDRPTTLFRVALDQLADPFAWWQIAQLNGLSDPSLPANVTLQLPASGMADNDGLPPQ